MLTLYIIDTVMYTFGLQMNAFSIKRTQRRETKHFQIFEIVDIYFIFDLSIYYRQDV